MSTNAKAESSARAHARVKANTKMEAKSGADSDTDAKTGSNEEANGKMEVSTEAAADTDTKANTAAKDEPLVQLGDLMRTMKEIDEVYDDYGSKSGLSISAFWLLYALLERECVTGATPFTQKQFCREWSFSPQTANSSLKKMQEQGYISLVPAPNNKKERLIEFTERGRTRAQELVAPLMDAEKRAFTSIDDSDRRVLLRTARQYKSLLEKEIGRIAPHGCKAEEPRKRADAGTE